MKISIVILAAGLGSRMKSQKPKVLQELCQKSMILHILKKAFTLSEDVSVVLSHERKQIEKELLKHFPNTQIVEQDLQAYPGTAGALRTFKPKNENVLILCGDMPLVEPTSLKTLLNNEVELALAVFKARDAKHYGRVVLKEDKVEKIIEFKDASLEERQINICNTGVYFIKSRLLKELLPLITNDNLAKEYYLSDIIKFARKRDVFIKAVFVNEDEFMGVNDKFELSMAEAFMQEKIKKYWMEQGVIFHLPQSTFIGVDVEFVGECEIYENVRIEGKSKLVNCVIKSSSVIENSFVENSHIGPLAHLRSDCELKNTHIGNFVECKNAKINTAKAGHLSYLGDCQINEGTNIGCGSITCNYDGIKKHKTLIGKNVFVGSHTQFIAPVKIEDEVIIAAGSTVDVNVKKGALFINRAGRKIVKDYYYKKFQK